MKCLSSTLLLTLLNPAGIAPGLSQVKAATLAPK